MSTAFDRVMSKGVPAQGGCIVYSGAKMSAGYGMTSQGKKRLLAHRVAYEGMVGPVPDGLVIDHLCRNRACVNPYHLEVVTFRENVLRGTSPTADNAKKTHCPKGHPYIEGNLVKRGRRAGRGRECAACNRARVRAYNAAKRTQAAA